MIFPKRATIVFCLLIVASASSAQDIQVRLCTAGAAGNYYASGKEIARQVKRSGLSVQPLETAGSMDNLEKIAANECDAGIVQIDAYLVYQDAHADDRLQIKRPQHLYDEFVHLICNREIGVESIGDLLGETNVRPVLVGPANSGGAITWGSFTLMDVDYDDIPMENIGGEEALSRVESGADASCMMFVSGLRSKWANNIDQSGETLNLTDVNDKGLGKAKFAGEPIYTFQEIPADTYPNMQADPGEVETLTVRAIFIVSAAWAEAFPSAYDRLIAGVERATPNIKKRVSSR